MNSTDWLLIVQPFLQQLILILGKIILALVVFLIGYWISVGIGKLISEILKSIKFNRLFEQNEWKRAFEKANIEVNPSEFIGAIFKWIFVIVSLLVAVDILALKAFGGLLTQLLMYIPNVVVAVLVFSVAVVISDFVGKLVGVGAERLGVKAAYLISVIVKWIIWIFVFFLILDQLLINNFLLRTLYSAIIYGIVGTLILGVGLAIGLGGKETAAKIISDLYHKLEKK